MTSYNGLTIYIHSVSMEYGELVAVVNKGETKTAFTFKLRTDRIEGLLIA